MHVDDPWIWMPQKWARLSIKPLCNPFSRDGIEADKLYSCMVCGRPTKNLDICSEGPLCSPACVDEFWWNFECASVGRKRFVQWRYWYDLFKKHFDPLREVFF